MDWIVALRTPARNWFEPAEWEPLRTRRRKAILLLVITAVLWSSSGLFIKIISWQPLAILSARSFIATLVVFLYLRPTRLVWTKIQLAGAVGYVCAQLFFIMGTKLTASANIIFLSYTAPLYIVLFGTWFLRERPQRADWVTMPFIFGGMLLFFGDDLSFTGFRGNFFGVLSGMAMAVMVLAMRHQKSGIPANTILLGNFIGIIIGLPALTQETFTLTSIAIILFLGTFQIGLSFVLYSIAIRHLQALESTLILTIEPLLNPLWVFLILSEIPGSLAFIGGALVLGAVIVRAYLSTRIA